MHKLFIKVAFQKHTPPLVISDICVAFVSFGLPEFGFSHGGGSGEELGRVSAWHPWILTAGRLAMDWQHFLPYHWKTSSEKKILFTTPSRPLTLIYVGSCFTVSKTVVAVESEANASGPTCMWHIYDKRSSTQQKHILMWAGSFMPESQLNLLAARPCTKCLAPSHGILSAHLILMHFISPPFPPLSL